MRVHYVLDPLGHVAQEALERLLEAFRRAQAIWSVNEEHRHGDWKRNAGAGISVGRRRVGVGVGAPRFIQTNAHVGFLSIGGTRIYFFPDRLIILGHGEVRTVSYSDLTTRAGIIRFVEKEGVPGDAHVLGTTWRYVNKDGGPDRRFRDNHQIPVVLYGTLDIAAATGLRLSLQTSTEDLATGAEKLLHVLQGAILELKSRRPGPPPLAPPPLEPPPDFAEEPPPPGRPAPKLLTALGDVLTFRWLTALPEWARLAVWGLLVALPPTALITWFARGGTSALVFLGASITLVVGGVSRAVHEELRHRGEETVEDLAARKSRFRAVLADELKGRPLDTVKFTDLVASAGISRREADAVADEMFRKIADRFARDGIISRHYPE